MGIQCGPTTRGEIRADQITISEQALLDIFCALLTKQIVGAGVLGTKAILEKAQEATACYLNAISYGNVDVESGKTH